MIVLLNTLFITGLFSFWVWTLKQDIEALRHDRASGAEAPEHEPALTHGHVHAHGAVPAVAHAGTRHVSRDRNGVPTWTIA